MKTTHTLHYRSAIRLLEDNQKTTSSLQQQGHEIPQKSLYVYEVWTTDRASNTEINP
jgi:hypothetical protein